MLSRTEKLAVNTSSIAPAGSPSSPHPAAVVRTITNTNDHRIVIFMPISL
jgi:hypothetical protein